MSKSKNRQNCRAVPISPRANSPLFIRKSGQLKLATHLQQTYLGRGIWKRYWSRASRLRLDQTYTDEQQHTNNHTNHTFPHTSFSFRVSDRHLRRLLIFIWAPLKPAGDKGKSQGKGIQVLRGILSPIKAIRAISLEKIKSRKTTSLKSRKFHAVFILSFVGSARSSGVKSDDRCAPASNIKPEINAQNISATEIEKACP